MIIETITNRDEWNKTLNTLPFSHVLQTWEWGEFKQTTTGWRPTRLAFRHEEDGEIVAMASVLTRYIGPLAVIYVPKGPALRYVDSTLLANVLDHLQKLSRKRFAIWLKIDPDIVGWTGVPGESDDVPYLPGQAVIRNLKEFGWQFSGDQVQFRNTVTLDLTKSEDELLAQMSQNTRRKVRTAAKKDVTIRVATTDDLSILYDLYRATGERDNFLTRPPEYYERAWRDFMEAGLAQALIAEYEGKAIAHVILLHFGQKCWYFYGASSDEERNRMPNYALQWEAMKWAKEQGYAVYDMWGAPNEFVETDSMWGVYQFKRGFRGTVTRHIGAWDYAPYPRLYKIYTNLWPRVLGWLRRRS